MGRAGAQVARRSRTDTRPAAAGCQQVGGSGARGGPDFRSRTGSGQRAPLCVCDLLVGLCSRTREQRTSSANSSRLMQLALEARTRRRTVRCSPVRVAQVSAPDCRLPIASTSLPPGGAGRKRARGAQCGADQWAQRSGRATDAQSARRQHQPASPYVRSCATAACAARSAFHEHPTLVHLSSGPAQHVRRWHEWAPRQCRCDARVARKNSSAKVCLQIADCG